MAKLTENHMAMALRMRTVAIPDDVIEDLTGVKLPIPEQDAVLTELVEETESLDGYDNDDADTQEEETIAVEA